MAIFNVNLNMDVDTVNTLRNAGFSLFGFKAASGSVSGGAPLVWFKEDDYSTEVEIEYEQEYTVYTSRSEIIPGGSITSSFTTDIDLGQTLVVNSGAGTGVVVPGSVPAAVGVRHETSGRFTTGIGQKSNKGDNNILCAFPLFPGFLDIIAPIEKIVLTFASNPVDTGAVIFQSFGPSAVIDLTRAGAPEAPVDVEYNIDTGWKDETYLQRVRAGVDLIPFLIESGTGSAVDRLLRQAPEKAA